MVEGLQGKVQRPKVEVVTIPETGRGVVAREKIAKAAYVCEYKTSKVYPAQDREPDRLHDRNARGMYTIQTAFEVKPGSGRLCFDATDRFHHTGRYINHVVKGANLKPVKPVFVREKWRVGFVSLREIEAGEELCYDYGLRTEEVWTRKGRLHGGRVTSGGAAVGVGEESDAGQLEAEEKADETEGQREVKDAEGKSEEKPGRSGVTEAKKKTPKRRSWWCPIVGCRAGPVQKIEQHFATKHGLPVTSRENYRLRQYKLAPTREAVARKLPNPYARHTVGSSRTLEEFVAAEPTTKQSYIKLNTLVAVKGMGKEKAGRAEERGRVTRAMATPGPSKKRSYVQDTLVTGSKGGRGTFKGDGRKGKGTAQRWGRDAPSEPSESEEDMGEGGPGSDDGGEDFLIRFGLFLLSPLGGSRKKRTASQIEMNMRKYLPEIGMDHKRLTELKPIEAYIKRVQDDGIGCSGVLQRLDVHVLALKFLNFTEEEEGLPALVQRAYDYIKSFRRSFKAEKVAKERQSVESKAYNPPDLSGVTSSSGIKASSRNS